MNKRAIAGLVSIALLTAPAVANAACTQAQLEGDWTLATTLKICSIHIDRFERASGSCRSYQSPGSPTFTTSTLTFVARMDAACRFTGKFPPTPDIKMGGAASFSGDVGRISGSLVGYGAFEMFH